MLPSEDANLMGNHLAIEQSGKEFDGEHYVLQQKALVVVLSHVPEAIDWVSGAQSQTAALQAAGRMLPDFHGLDMLSAQAASVGAV